MTSLTFGFSKKKDVTKLKSSIINEQEKESDDEGEIIRIIEENEIIGLVLYTLIILIINFIIFKIVNI